MPDYSKLADEAMEITAQIKPLLAGKGQEVQGAVLADLLAIWIAGHEPGAREIILQAHIEAMRPLIEANEKMLGLDALFWALGKGRDDESGRK